MRPRSPSPRRACPPLSPQIFQIKEQLQEKEGIDVKQIRLISGGKQLNDNETIEASKIEPGGTIHMVLSLRGGRA